MMFCFNRHVLCNLLFLFCTYSGQLFLAVKYIIENGTLIVCSKIQSAIQHSFVVKHRFTIPHQGQPSPPAFPL